MGEEKIDIGETEGGNNDDHRSNGRLRLHLVLVVAQATFSGFEVLSRLALNHGAGKFSFSFYRNCIASVVLAVVGFFLERKRIVPITLKDTVKVFFLGFIGVTVNQVLYLAGLEFTSAVFASTIRNCIPVFTFLMALLSRKEKLNLRTRSGQAKLVGCTLGVCGSVILSLYKGPTLIRSSLSIAHNAHNQQHLRSIDLRKKRHVQLFSLIKFNIASWTLGALCLILSCLSFSSFLVLQVPILTKYPVPILFASCSCFSSLIQLPVLAAVFEPHGWSMWRNLSRAEVVGIAYAGAVASGFVAAAQSWGVHRSGPVLVAAYQPLETAITGIMGLVFLAESLHLGSVIGAIVVVIGLYLLVWGQEKERQLNLLRESQESQEKERQLNLLRDLQEFQFKLKNGDSSKVYPELGAEDSVTPADGDSQQAVVVSDMLDKSKRWKVYTINNFLNNVDKEQGEQ